MGKKSLAGIVISSLAFGTLLSGCETTPAPRYHHYTPSRTIVAPTPRYIPPRRSNPVIIVPPRSPPRYIPPRNHPPIFYNPRHTPFSPQYCPPPRYIPPRNQTPMRRSSPSTGSQRFRLNWTH